MNLPKHVSHLKPSLIVFNNIFDNDKSLNHEMLGLMSSAFIRFFDTLPIYNEIKDADEAKWSMILKAKKVAGLLLRIDLIHGLRSSMAILKWRKEVMFHNKEILLSS